MHEHSVGATGRYSNPLDQHMSLQELQQLLSSVEASSRAPEQVPRAPARIIRRRLGAALVQQVIAEYKAGSSMQQLAMKHGTSHVAMWNLLTKEQVPMRYQSLLPHQITQVFERYQAGKSIYGVADKLGIPKTTVARTLKKAGVQMRTRGKEI